MKHRIAATLTLSFGALVLGAAVYFHMRPAAAPAGEAAAAPVASETVAFRMEQQWLIRMKLAAAEHADVAPQILSTGRVAAIPSNRAVVSSAVAGTLANERLPRIGEEVSAGQVLATVSQTLTAAETAQLRVEAVRIEAEKRRLAQSANEARVRLTLARTEFERATRLFEQKALPQRQVQLAEADMRAGEAALAAIEDEREALDAPAPPAPAFTVRAPIGGTVVEVRKAMGEQVLPGEVILEIVNLDRVWVEAPVYERDLGRLRAGGPAVFTTIAAPDHEVRGALVHIGAIVDETSRTATAVFETANPGRRLKVGMQANVRLEAEGRTAAVLVPREAVLEHEGKRIVYVMVSGEEFRRVEVQVGGEYGARIAVLSGLKAGERVVTQGAYQLKLQELRPADAGVHSHEV